MNGPYDWSREGDFIDDPDAPERPLVVESPIAKERRGGKSLTKQAEIDRRRHG